MKTVGTVVMLALVVTAWSVMAAERKAPPCPAAQRVERMTEGLTVTAEQKTKFGDLCKEFGPKLMDVMKKVDVLTPEQKTSQREAMKAAKDAGKTGKELREAVQAAVKLTDDQKAKQVETRKEMGALEKELREKVMAVLTPEQKDELKKKADEARKKAAEARKAAK